MLEYCRVATIIHYLGYTLWDQKKVLFTIDKTYTEVSDNWIYSIEHNLTIYSLAMKIGLSLLMNYSIVITQC